MRAVHGSTLRLQCLIAGIGRPSESEEVADYVLQVSLITLLSAFDNLLSSESLRLMPYVHWSLLCMNHSSLTGLHIML